ncbi:hypothetical protein Tco_0681079 [Tanacetum coccineum]|uniref:Uncharacterized protein n=1 Tax=Tanacetum coccineum TaxID=301880 RepID=A0ABQ4XNG1_9ASTR
MAAPGPSNQLARLVIDELMEFSGETQRVEYNMLMAINDVIGMAEEKLTTKEAHIEIMEAESTWSPRTRGIAWRKPPRTAFVDEYASGTYEREDARLSKFESISTTVQSEMGPTKINTVLRHHRASSKAHYLSDTMKEIKLWDIKFSYASFLSNIDPNAHLTFELNSIGHLRSLSKAHLPSLNVDPFLACYIASKLQVPLSMDNPFQPA